MNRRSLGFLLPEAVTGSMHLWQVGGSYSSTMVGSHERIPRLWLDHGVLLE